MGKHFYGLSRAKLLAGIAILGTSVWAEGAEDKAFQCLKGNYAADETIERCNRAIEVASLAKDVRANCLTRRALAWFSKGDLDKASDDTGAAIEINPKSFWAYNSRAVVRMQQGNVDGALGDYDQAIKLKPDYGFALANRGNAWLSKGDAERAVADLTAAITLSLPQPELAYLGRGRAWLAQGKFELALADFDTALKVRANYGNALSGRAFAHFAQGKFNAAEEDFSLERKVRADVDNTLGLYLTQARQGNPRAKETLSKSVEGSDPQVGVPPALAFLLDQLSAQDLLSAASDMNAKVQTERICKAHFLIGEKFLLVKDRIQAVKHLQQVVDQCGKGFPEYAVAVAEIARIK